MASTPAHADSSAPPLASCYERHMALLDGVACGWGGRSPPLRMRAGATGSRHSLAIRTDASQWAWGEGFGIEPRKLMAEAAAVAAGDTTTIAQCADGSLWQ